MKITFIGAGSTIFAKNVLGDCILTPELGEFEISLYDIDETRLDESYTMLMSVNRNMKGKASISKTLDRREALKDANYVVNAIQVGGYEPCTVTDFEIPKKYGLRQTIADTLGVGGVFRALRTIPVLDDIAADMREVCPDALFLNYTNPMAMLTGYMQRYCGVKTIGLCHSVQICTKTLFEDLGMEQYIDNCREFIAGINHQAWLLKCEDLDGIDLYPEIQKRIASDEPYNRQDDLVRLELCKQFGYYITESSEHNAEYTPYFIKDKYPELIERFNIPLDEYPRRCVQQIEDWKQMRETLTDSDLTHEKSREYAADIIKAMETDKPYRVNANVMNDGLITNLPYNCCVEVPCMVDRNGVTPCIVGDLPEQCAAHNRTNIGVQQLTIQAARTRKKADVYRAVMLDPHTSAELSIDDIIAMCDELFEAHKDWMPEYH